MALFVQCLVACALFTALILLPQLRNPMSQIASYPPEIQARVAGLAQYRDHFVRTKKRNIARKIIGTLLIVVILAALAYFSGKTSFSSAFLHVFLLFFAVNLYDLVVLDLLVFRHSRRVVIPGTEDMVSAYRNPAHHIKGAVKGVAIGALVAALSAGLVVLFMALKG